MPRSPSNRRELDKFARNLVKDLNKSIERAARRNPSRVPLQVDATATGGTAAYSGEAIETAPYLALLLHWLVDRAAAQPAGFHNVTEFTQEQGLSVEEAEVLALQLEERDLVTLARTMTVQTAIHLTGKGRVEARHLQNLFNNRATRQRYATNALLEWLYDVGHDQAPVEATRFIATPHLYFAGLPLDGDDIYRAVAQLEAQTFIERIRDEPTILISITPAGVTRVLQGGSVNDPQPPAPSVTYNNYLPNAQGVLIGQQQNFTQNNNAGIDPTAFIQLAGYVGQISSTLNMAEPDRVELERVAQELHAEATSANPEPGRLRQFTTQLKEKLLEAGTTIAATMGAQMAEQALGTIV